MTTRLVLIRHGITEWNKERRYCGQSDVSLSAQGVSQAKKLRKRLKAFEFDRIYSSDRRRALQTSRIIFNVAKIIKIRGLKEINFGVLEGLEHKEIIEKYPSVYKKWLTNPFKNRIPKAETMNAFKDRISSALRRIIRLNSGKTIAVVCHGGTIGIFVSSILKSKKFWRYVPAAASITVVERKKSELRIKQFNDTAHLR